MIIPNDRAIGLKNSLLPNKNAMIIFTRVFVIIAIISPFVATKIAICPKSDCVESEMLIASTSAKPEINEMAYVPFAPNQYDANWLSIETTRKNSANFNAGTT